MVVARAWLVQYDHEQTWLGLNTPPKSPRDSAWGNIESGWATAWETRPASPEVRAAVTSAALAARDNQTAPQATFTTEEEEDWGGPSVIENMDYDSAFNTKVCDTQNTHTHISVVCFNVDATTGPTQLEEVNLTYMTKTQDI